MHRRLWVVTGILVAVTAVAVAAAGVSAYFWDRSRADLISKGVTIGGIDVGGLRAARARRLLAARFAQRLRQPVRLVRGDYTFTIHPTSAGLTVDLDRMVSEAVAASRSGGFWQRLNREVRGTPVHVAIPLRAGLSRSHLALVTRRVSRAIDRPAHSARLITKALATGITIVRSHWGVAVDRPKLGGEIAAALLTFHGPGEIQVPVRPVRPKLGLYGLSRRYSTYILVSRESP
jgi:hypothetical protein